MSADVSHTPPQSPSDDAAVLDASAINQIRWRCRRGLLENDLFIERFFQRHAHRITQRQARGLMQLMDLSDNDLMDLLLRRQEPTGELATAEIEEVLAMLRSPVLEDPTERKM